MRFYETIAQVIPVLVVAFVLQTKQKSVKQATHFFMSLESKAKSPRQDEPWAFVTKIFNRSLFLVLIAEVTALLTIFFGGAPWPVSLLVWPGLIVILWLLFTELHMSVNRSIERASIKWMKRDIRKVEEETEALRRARLSLDNE